MAEFSPEGGDVTARILYWGVQGAGKTTNLEAIHRKLRADHRGELRSIPTRVDPSVHYEELPIELGELGGVRTRLQVLAVPGGADQAPTRKQLLDQVDGVVFVIDAQRDRIEENLTSFAELRRGLAAYGRTLADVPLVLQYNKRDLADAYALEELHRKLDTSGAAAFEAVASEATAVLPTLTTISKRVVRFLRERPAEPTSSAPSMPAPPPGVSNFIDGAVETDADSEMDADSEVDVESDVESELVVEAELVEESPPVVDLAISGSGRSILSASYHPEFDAAQATASEARALLDSSFESAREQIEKEEVGFGNFEIAAVGRAEISGRHSVSMPVLLRDESGHSLPVKLTVKIEPDREGELG